MSTGNSQKTDTKNCRDNGKECLLIPKKQKKCTKKRIEYFNKKGDRHFTDDG